MLDNFWTLNTFSGLISPVIPRVVEGSQTFERDPSTTLGMTLNAVRLSLDG